VKNMSLLVKQEERHCWRRSMAKSTSMKRWDEEAFAKALLSSTDMLQRRAVLGRAKGL